MEQVVITEQKFDFSYRNTFFLKRKYETKIFGKTKFRPLQLKISSIYGQKLADFISEALIE